MKVYPMVKMGTMYGFSDRIMEGIRKLPDVFKKRAVELSPVTPL